MKKWKKKADELNGVTPDIAPGASVAVKQEPNNDSDDEPIFVATFKRETS